MIRFHVNLIGESMPGSAEDLLRFFMDEYGDIQAEEPVQVVINCISSSLVTELQVWHDVSRVMQGASNNENETHVRRQEKKESRVD